MPMLLYAWIAPRYTLALAGTGTFTRAGPEGFVMVTSYNAVGLWTIYATPNHPAQQTRRNLALSLACTTTLTQQQHMYQRPVRPFLLAGVPGSNVNRREA